MTEKELQQAGHLYKLDDELWNLHVHAMRLSRILNNLPDDQTEQKKALVQKLFGHAGKDAYVEAPFYCDYGYNIRVGDHFFSNYDCVFLDCGKITIGEKESYVELNPENARLVMRTMQDATVNDFVVTFTAAKINDAPTKSAVAANLEEWYAELQANIDQIKTEMD